jgi:hypothetical protein
MNSSITSDVTAYSSFLGPLRRFTFILVAGVFVCIFAIAMLRAMGRAQPIGIDGWFTNPDGSPCVMPCLFGIRPGVTPFQDVEKLLTVHPVLHRSDVQLTLSELGAQFVTATYSLDISWYGSDIVSHIIVTAARPERLIKAATVGDILATFDPPELVEPVKLSDDDSSASSMTLQKLVYRACQLVVYLDIRGSLTEVAPRENIRYLILTSGNNQAQFTSPAANLLPWQGMSISQYDQVRVSSGLTRISAPFTAVCNAHHSGTP